MCVNILQFSHGQEVLKRDTKPNNFVLIPKSKICIVTISKQNYKKVTSLILQKSCNKWYHIKATDITYSTDYNWKHEKIFKQCTQKLLEISEYKRIHTKSGKNIENFGPTKYEHIPK